MRWSLLLDEYITMWQHVNRDDNGVTDLLLDYSMETTFSCHRAKVNATKLSMSICQIIENGRGKSQKKIFNKEGDLIDGKFACY
jgi:hypothetical protein